MTYSVRIRRISNNTTLAIDKIYEFDISEVPTGTWGINVKRFNLDEPDGDGSSNLSVNLGASKTISFPFKLLNTGTDATANQTTPENIITIAQKVTFLIGAKGSDGVTDTTAPFLKTGIDDFYFVDMVSHTGSWINNKVQLDSVSFSPDKGNPNSLTGNMSFVIGGGRQ